MVLVHVAPALGGRPTSAFKDLNTFTFSQLFDAPSAGLRNYTGVLFDPDNPLHSGFFGAVRNTTIYTVCHRRRDARRRAGGRAAAQPPDPRPKLMRTLMLTPWIVPTFVVAVLWQFMWQSDVGIVNKVLVDYTRLLSDRPVWLIGSELAVGDHHPEHLARAAVRDADLPRRPAGDPAGAATRRPRSTAPDRGGASATSRCRCCGR